MKYILVFCISICFLNCKEKVKETITEKIKEDRPQQITLIPTGDYIYFFSGEFNSHSEIDSIRFIDELDTIALNGLLSNFDSSGLYIYVKPTSGSGSFASGMKLMEWLKESKLNYTVVQKISPEEKERFSVTDLSDFEEFQRKMQDRIEGPKAERDGIALLFFVNKNGKVTYKISNDYSEEQSILVSPGTTEQFVSIVNKAEESFKKSDRKFQIFIGGDNEATFKQFKKLWDALRKTNHYDFQFLKPQAKTEFKTS